MQRQTTPFRPVSLVCAAAPADLAWLEQWERHLNPLQQTGLLTFWSAQHLLAGVDRMEQIIAHLDHADCIVLLISSDFLADQDCLTLMQRALGYQQTKSAVVIPLLLRPVEWQDSAIGSLPCLPTSQVPVTQWLDPDEALQACVRGLRSRLKLPAQRVTLVSSSTRFNTNRARMLRRLRRSYRDLLAQSLEGITWIELGFTEKPEAVQNVANLALRFSQQTEQALPEGTTIIQVYERAEEELLILGEPGVGKSTELLHLAQHLVTQAETDETCLLPVILPLSSWAVKRAELSDWMAEQIAVTYDIPRKVSQQWVREEQILPLLDGLDEMEEDARPACIAVINTYHREHLTPLVVCSRREEYERVAGLSDRERSGKARLLLQSAVVVRPLTSEQVERVLDLFGDPVAGLRTAISKQPLLRDLAETPLMLSVLMLTYQGTTVYTRSFTAAELERQVWTDYIELMVTRKGNAKRYPMKRTCFWLSWLAQQMQNHSQSILFLESLQPDWLSQKGRVFYQLSCGIVFGSIGGLFLGWLCALVVALFYSITADSIRFSVYTSFFSTLSSIPLYIGLVTGFLLTIFESASAKSILLGEGLTWSWKKASAILPYGIVIGLAFWLLSFQVFAGIIALVVSLYISLYVGFSSMPITQYLKNSPNEGIRRSAKSGLFSLLFIGFIALLPGMIFWILQPILTLLFVLGVGVAAGLHFGLRAVVQHGALRFWLWSGHTFPWRAQAFLDDASARILMRRVGGGYSFVHRRLLDYFADKYTLAHQRSARSEATTPTQPLR